ncbi:MAG: AmmeMemoRadiSam system protein A [Thermoplasmatota archaeon]
MDPPSAPGDLLSLAIGAECVAHVRHHLARSLAPAWRETGRSGDATVAARVASSAFATPRAAFVTLMREDELRGCSGFVEARYPLGRTLELASEAAANDPRFEQVAAGELPEIEIEVSILSVPVTARSRNPEALAEEVRIGEHGLIVESGRARGLLLPQVAIEHGFTAAAFLSACCRKAGLPADAWRREDAHLRWSLFTAQVFAEDRPGGLVLARGPSARAEVA